MALDEALLGLAAEDGQCWLRVYRWAQPAVSFGYFDRLEAVRALFPERDLVRRWTGGGAVDHLQDVTFALAAPRSHPIGQMSALDSYREIHRRLAEMLRHLGLAARLAGSGGEPAPRAGGIAPCFVSPVCADVMVGKAKVAGGAQRRTRLGLLHQGSVQSDALTPPIREALRGELAAAGTRRSLPDPGRFETVAQELAARRYAQVAWLARW